MKAFLRRLFSPRSALGLSVLVFADWLAGTLEGSGYILSIEPVTAGLILAGIGAAGGIGSQLIGGGGDAEFDLERQVVSGFVPNADPVLAALQREQLLAQGVDPSQAGAAGSPILRFLQFPRSQGPFTVDFNTTVFQNAATAISRGVAEGVAQGLSDEEIRARVLADPNVANQFQGFRENAAVGSGFSSFEDLLNTQINFERERPEEAARSRALLEDVRAGQAASTRGISQILQDFPVPTQARIDELAGGFTQDLRRQRLQEANVIGSPADLRNIEREGLLQAIGLLGGQQQLAGGALQAFRGDQTARIANALAVSERGIAGQLSAAELAGAQARAFSELGNRTDLANLQANQQQASEISNIFGVIGGIGLEGALGTRQRPGVDPK